MAFVDFHSVEYSRTVMEAFGKLVEVAIILV